MAETATPETRAKRKYTKRQPQEVYAARGRKGGLRTQSIETAIKRIVDRAPEITPEQAARIRAILPVGG